MRVPVILRMPEELHQATKRVAGPGGMNKFILDAISARVPVSEMEAEALDPFAPVQNEPNKGQKTISWLPISTFELCRSKEVLVWYDKPIIFGDCHAALVSASAVRTSIRQKDNPNPPKFWCPVEGPV
jgi:hypothetical protein